MFVLSFYWNVRVHSASPLMEAVINSEMVEDVVNALLFYYSMGEIYALFWTVSSESCLMLCPGIRKMIGIAPPQKMPDSSYVMRV